MSENFYETLEIPETSTIDEIKKSFRRLSMMYHPDKNKNNPDATAKFQKISEAYETLGDADKKREYDAMRNNPFVKMMNGHSNGGFQHPNPMEDILANLFGGGGIPFGGIPFAHMQSFGNEQGSSPFPGNIRIFHNGIPINPQGFSQGMQKPSPIIKNIDVSIDKILTGTIIPIDIERWTMQDGNKTIENETIYVTVPKGIDEGELIILKDKGNVIREDCKGDIKIFVKIENNTEFKRNGIDLIYEKVITVKEALCGFTFELKYITGKLYTINNNSGNIISNGYRKTIPNMGLSRDNHTGNLIIIFTVKFPDKLTDEIIEQLKKIEF
jgi:DnaJ-class molecular chaperone